MYDSARYITITGNRFPNTPTDIREDQRIINQIHTQFISPPEVTRSHRIVTYPPQYISDHQVIEKALRAKNGDKFQRLWRGDKSGYQSPSEAHFAIIAMLAYWTNGDVTQVDRLFRQSGQFDEETARKWDTRHQSNGKTYGQATIEKALATRQNHTPAVPRVTTKTHVTERSLF
jgi:primase-polymerase (primpol)-like protein